MKILHAVLNLVKLWQTARPAEQPKKHGDTILVSSGGQTWIMEVQRHGQV